MKVSSVSLVLVGLNVLCGGLYYAVYKERSQAEIHCRVFI